MRVCFVISFLFCFRLGGWAQDNPLFYQKRHIIGLNILPYTEALLIRNNVAYNLNYLYKYSAKNKLCISAYYSEKNEGNYYEPEIDKFFIYTKQIKLGLQRIIFSSTEENFQIYNAFLIGYTEYDIAGFVVLEDKNLNQKASIPIRGSFATPFVELQFGQIY